MKKYVAVMKFDNGTEIPARLEAEDKADAFVKMSN